MTAGDIKRETKWHNTNKGREGRKKQCKLIKKTHPNTLNRAINCRSGKNFPTCWASRIHNVFYLETLTINLTVYNSKKIPKENFKGCNCISLHVNVPREKKRNREIERDERSLNKSLQRPRVTLIYI